MDDRDIAFDLLLDLADFTLDRDLPKTSARIEAALDAFLEETGRSVLRRSGAAPRPRPQAARRRAAR